MVRIYRRSDAKSNPDGKDIWERVKPSELGLNPAALSGSARASAHAVSGRIYGGAPRTARGSQGPARKNEPRGEVDETAAVELATFIQNDADLYRQQYEPIIKNLEKKRAKGIYDHEKALTLWKYMADNGARKYAADFGEGDWKFMFDSATRFRTAEILRDYYEVEVGIRKSNYATPKIRKINEWDSNAQYPGYIVNEWDYNAAYVSPAPRARGPTRLSGIRGKKNPVMVLVNAAGNPMSVMALLRNGQYFVTVNLDRKEYIDWHDLGTGVKLWEICANVGPGVLAYLTAQSTDPSGIKKYIESPRGPGGEWVPGTFAKTQYAGRWANDRIVTVGDYDKTKLYEKAKHGEFKNISGGLIPEYNEFIGDGSPEMQIGRKEY